MAEMGIVPGTGRRRMAPFGRWVPVVAVMVGLALVGGVGVGDAAAAQAYIEWGHDFGGADTDFGGGVAVDGGGNVYVTGVFKGTVDFDPGPGTMNLTSVGVEDVFVTKSDFAGNLVWAAGFPSGSCCDGQLPGMAVDGSGNVYVADRFEGTADFDPGPGTMNLTSTGGSSDGYLVKLGPSGNLVWAAGFGGGGFDDAWAVAADGAGNVYVTGWFEGTADFDPGPGTMNLTSAGGRDGFLVKLGPSGNLVWAAGFGGGGTDYGGGVAAGGGNVYVTGGFEGTADFDPGPGTMNLTSAGGRDGFLVKLGSSGNLVWAGGFGGGGFDGASAVAAGGGNVYVTGWFIGQASFDLFFRPSGAGSTDVFVFKMADPVSLIEPPGVLVEGQFQGSVSSGDTVSTDHAGNGATRSNPVELAITSPRAGSVFIMGGPGIGGGSGYTVFGEAVWVTAPEATPENPLVLTFTLDSTLVPPGEDLEAIAILRNGAAVPPCSGPLGVASPDPCVSARGISGDDVTVTVLTSHASTWEFAFSNQTCGGVRATLAGTDGDDTLVGTVGDDVIWAGDGDDVVRGRGGNDLICLGDGDDTAHGGPGRDTILGGKGADLLSGGGKKDKLIGGSGDDALVGGGGNDVLKGKRGDDVGDGGPGADRCVSVETASSC